MNTKQQAGRLGGLATYRKYGKIHMKRIGKKGGQVFWMRYRLIPIGTSNFAIVSRETGEFVSYTKQWRM